MILDVTWLTSLLIFVGIYYLILFLISFINKNNKNEKIDKYFYFIFIPAKNEEKVIKNSIQNFLKIDNYNFRLIIVNDNSNDYTHFIVKEFVDIDKRVVLLDKFFNSNKVGKGAVLNFAFNQLKFFLDNNFLEPLNLEPDFKLKFDDEHIIIGVFDADSKPQEDVFDKINKIFSNYNFDAVQTAVRIYNRNQSLWAKMQDIEFLGFSKIIQKARMNFGSVGLGGNGQFSKYSSLLKIGEKPWGDTLTEDFELGLRFISNGMKLGFVNNIITEQEGVINLKSLLKQRTRWLQGHFTNWKYILPIIKSKSNLITKIDTIIYLTFVTSVFLVFLSILLSIISILRFIYLKNNLLDIFYNKNYFLGILMLIIYSFIFIPMFIYAIVEYYKHDKLLNKILYVFLFALYTYIWLPSGFRAIYRIIKGEREWIKTERFLISELPLFQLKKVEFERRAYPRFPASNGVLINNSPAFLVDLSKCGCGALIYKQNLSSNSIKLSFLFEKSEVQGSIVRIEKINNYIQKVGIKFNNLIDF